MRLYYPKLASMSQPFRHTSYFPRVRLRACVCVFTDLKSRFFINIFTVRFWSPCRIRVRLDKFCTVAIQIFRYWNCAMVSCYCLFRIFRSFCVSGRFCFVFVAFLGNFIYIFISCCSVGYVWKRPSQWLAVLGSSRSLLNHETWRQPTKFAIAAILNFVSTSNFIFIHCPSIYKLSMIRFRHKVHFGVDF